MPLVTFAEILTRPPVKPGRPWRQSRTQTTHALELLFNYFLYKLLNLIYEDDS